MCQARSTSRVGTAMRFGFVTMMWKKTLYLLIRRVIVSMAVGECSQSMLSIFWMKVPCLMTAPTRSMEKAEVFSQ